MSIKDFENNKYYKYVTSIGERAIIYNNKIDREIDRVPDACRGRW